jgi:uncharacterized protein YbcV (DUF1398 family)
MFTLDQIRMAHSKVKSGADFPAYIRDLRSFGVHAYETFVSDGHSVFRSEEGEEVISPAKYDTIQVQEISHAEVFVQKLNHHQQGRSSYPEFCADCAATGIEKWAVDLNRMTCSYFDKAENKILVEQIPA